MTTPEERIRAQIAVGRFLHRLIDCKQTKRVPLAIRKEAHRLAKHYPMECEIEAER